MIAVDTRIHVKIHRYIDLFRDTIFLDITTCSKVGFNSPPKVFISFACDSSETALTTKR